jgi:hypothetical protein
VQDLWDKNFEAAPNSREGSIIEEDVEEEVVSSPRNDDDADLPMANTSLAGKIRETCESNLENSGSESPTEDPTEGVAPTRKCQAIAKQRIPKDMKRQKMAPPRTFVQTRLTDLEEKKKRATLAATQLAKPAKASSTEELTILDDSSRDSDGVPRVAR